MDLDSYIALLLAVSLSFITIVNNASVITGPLINAGFGVVRSKIIGVLSITIGSMAFGSLIKPPYRCDLNIDLYSTSISIYLSTLLPFIIATSFKIPFSLSLAIISSVAGSSIVYGLSIYSWLSMVSILWLVSALLSTASGFYIYRSLIKISRSLEGFKALNISRIGIFLFSIFLGMLLGANNLGFISSILCHLHLYIIALAGGLAIAISNIDLLEGLFRMVSVRYISTLSIQISLAIYTFISTYLGLPASLVYIQLFTLIGYRLSTIISIGFRELIYRVIAVWILSITSSIAVSIFIGITIFR